MPTVAQITIESVSGFLTQLPFISYRCNHTNENTQENIVTKSRNHSQMAQIATGVVAAGLEKYWSRFDVRDRYDVFIVVSEGANGEHVARAVFAPDPDDARQAHRDTYADEPIVEVHQ